MEGILNTKVTCDSEQKGKNQTKEKKMGQCRVLNLFRNLVEPDKPLPSLVTVAASLPRARMREVSQLERARSIDEGQ
jgi:hypothetical protein